MAAKPKRERYSVLVRLDVVTDLEVYADSWDAALEKAKAITVQDAADLAGSYIDGDGVSLESISKWEED